MRREQLTVIAVAVTLAAFSVLCPSWRCVPEYESISRFAGYHFVFAPPPPEGLRARIWGARYRETEPILVYVDELQLELQFWWMALSAVGVLLILEYDRSRWAVFGGVILVHGTSNSAKA